MQLTPSFPFTLSFFLTDHTDLATYYCQAIVYDSTTGEILNTVNLDKSSTNDHLFSKVAQAPGDVSGHGRSITVVATAYTDSAYTTKSPLYQEQSEVHIVKSEKLLGGSGGYASIDYRVIKDLIDEAVSKIPKQEKINIPTPEKMVMPEMQWDKVLTAIETLKTEISLIPKERVDITPLLYGLDSLKNDVQAIYIPETDISPILSAIDDTRNELALINEEQKQHREDKMNDLHEKLPGLIDEHSGRALGRAKFNFNMPFTGTTESVNPNPAPIRPPIDINNLM